jgi:hypothetical protein
MVTSYMNFQEKYICSRFIKTEKQFVPVNGSDQMLGQCFRLEGVESQPNVPGPAHVSEAPLQLAIGGIYVLKKGGGIYGNPTSSPGK